MTAPYLKKMAIPIIHNFFSLCLNYIWPGDGNFKNENEWQSVDHNS